ncbi:kinesin-like protein KIN-4C [Rutidosis leptorrhynchoides]|uniref:kinesin-like protein KIN-4C n=1 Tax=Rutidosis leptorrhynchoides TaxID=125765 RepID=UPI003A99E9DB
MDGSQLVQVAVNILPSPSVNLLVNFSNEKPQVQIGSHSFTFDHVYGVEGFHLFLYFMNVLHHLWMLFFMALMTGSGKTYTMGTNGKGSYGIIPKVIAKIFQRVEESKRTIEFLINVSFIEEEIFDLLGSSRAPIQIRERANGEIFLDGVIEPKVTSQDEMDSFLLCGSKCRATGSTNMNSQLSRSHAIFTIYMKQNRIHGDIGDDILLAKLHLVDSSDLNEPSKQELMECVCKKDSLGGNNKTVMIACVSLLSTNAEETLNTLNYAKRARNIQNKAIVCYKCLYYLRNDYNDVVSNFEVNRAPVTINQMQTMRHQIEQLKEAELLHVKGGYSNLFEEHQVYCREKDLEIKELQHEIVNLKRQLEMQSREKDLEIKEF